MTDYKIKRQILITISISLTVIVCFAILGIYFVQRNNIEQHVSIISKAQQETFALHLESEASLLHTIIGFILEKDELQKIWLEQDRNKLLATTTSLLDEIKKRNNITHLYFHQTNSVNFLRVHNPARFGDLINRFTLKRCVETQAPTHGIELGPLGTFTLRVVHPWIINGKTIGYIELGEEISHLFPALQKQLDVQVIITIDKKHLIRQQWEEGMEMLGRTGDWDALPYCTIIDSTLKLWPDDLNNLKTFYTESHKKEVITTLGDRFYHGELLPLIDADDNLVGDVLVLCDTTEQIILLRQLVLGLAWFSSALLLCLFVFFYHYLGRVEKYISINEQENLKKQKELTSGNSKLQHEIHERIETEKMLQRSYQTQTVLNQFLHLSLESETLEELLKGFLDCLISLPFLELEPKGVVFLLQEEQNTKKLVLKAHTGVSEQLLEKCKEIPFNTCICGQTASTGKLIFTENINHCHDISFEDMKPHGHYSVPIMSGGHKVIGVFTINIKPHTPRNKKIEEILLAAASVAGGTIDRLSTELERKNLEIQLRQSQKMESIGTLASGIAHDFNNILTPILGYSQLILNKTTPESLEYDMQKSIISAAIRAKELVQQILLFSRQTEKSRKPTDMCAIAKEALKLLRSSLPNTIDMQVDTFPKNCFILADPTEIHQIIMNLCTNAHYAMIDHGGTLKIALSHETIDLDNEKLKQLNLTAGRFIVLKVADTGHGMDKQTKERVFDPYFTTREKSKGTGLGLSVVHGIVKTYNGAIFMESTPGQGTVFQIYFPIATTSPIKTKHSPHKSTENTPGGDERILCVDDEEEVVLLEKRILEELGYQVTTCTESTEAIQKFNKSPNKFDLVITDYTMPKMSGILLCQKIFTTRRDIPIILCTGFSDLISLEKANSLGFYDVLMKPIIRDTMASMVRTALDEQNKRSHP
ncbi:MAG: response regulator [Desulfobulbaceae bacterium]|nr:response regulator [Desulfobulbaceae bacterium]